MAFSFWRRSEKRKDNENREASASTSTSTSSTTATSKQILSESAQPLSKEAALDACADLHGTEFLIFRERELLLFVLMRFSIFLSTNLPRGNEATPTMTMTKKKQKKLNLVFFILQKN